MTTAINSPPLPYISYNVTGEMTRLITATMYDNTNTPYIVTAEPTRSSLERAICATILTLLIMTAISGNVIVLVSLVQTRSLREQASNYLIANLAVTDLGTSLIVMLPANVCLLLDTALVEATLCNIICAMNYCCIIVSMLSLSFISIDRYFAVIHALKYYSHVNIKHITCCIAYCWFQGLIFASAPVIKNWVHYDYWEVVCAINWHYEKPQVVYYVITACVLCFLMPASIMTYCYTLIIMEARKCKVTPTAHVAMNTQRVTTIYNTTNDGTTQTRSTTQPQAFSTYDKIQSRNTHRRILKAITSLLIVVVIFFTCMTPFCVTKFLKVIAPHNRFLPPYINLVAAYFGYFSSCVNPFIYGIFRPDFAAAYKKLFQRMKQRLLEIPGAQHNLV